jgi:hypothetical protein
MTPREQELTSREMLERPELLGIRLKEKHWADVAALVRYARHDVPAELAMTDPALYKTLRDRTGAAGAINPRGPARRRRRRRTRGPSPTPSRWPR